MSKEMFNAKFHNAESLTNAEITYSALNGGDQYLIKFENGFGASVVRHDFSYGGRSGLWELAVIMHDSNGWDLTYDTPITGDVLGHLSGDKVVETLKRIQKM